MVEELAFGVSVDEMCMQVKMNDSWIVHGVQAPEWRPVVVAGSGFSE